jgi:hypothetical protein
MGCTRINARFGKHHLIGADERARLRCIRVALKQFNELCAAHNLAWPLL